MAETVTREQLAAMVGRELGVSPWFLIDQERVDEAEHGRAGANAESEREDDGGTEPALEQYCSQSMADVGGQACSPRAGRVIPAPPPAFALHNGRRERTHAGLTPGLSGPRSRRSGGRPARRTPGAAGRS